VANKNHFGNLILATNLQVFFMNETASDEKNDNDHTHQSLPCFDLSNNLIQPRPHPHPPSPQNGRNFNFSQFLPTNIASSYERFKPPPRRPPFWGEEDEEEEPQDFFGQQAKLQGEARQALAQAKEIAKLELTQVCMKEFCTIFYTTSC
jgi:Schwannomin-interacting protein 1